MKITKNFTLEELINSQTAKAKKIDNTPTEDAIINLIYLAVFVLQPVRELWGKPIKVNSGYRCQVLNDAVGGSKKSQHLTGHAADITTGDKDWNKKLFEMISYSNIEYDQLIDEKNYQWIHISFRYKNNRRKEIHL